MSTRIYAVHGSNTFRLVEATSKHAALRHVANGLFDAEVADQKTLVSAMKNGVQVEVAGQQYFEYPKE